MIIAKPFQHLVLLTSLLISTGNAYATTSESIINELKQTLPNQTIDLTTIIGLGVVYGQSFKEVKSQAVLVDTYKLDAESAFVPKFTFSVYDQQSEADVTNTTFSPTEFKAFNYEVGISKYFTSGTGLELTYNHLNYDPTPVSNFNYFHYEKTATLKLSQSLWKDSFGKASRSMYKAGKLGQEAQNQQFERAANAWFSSFAGQLYKAWATQQSAQANLDSYQRRKQLLNIANVNKRRGNINSKDYYQLEASVVSAEIAYKNALDEMQRLWQDLIINLGLPQHWSKADPLKIPLQIDEPMQEAKKVCQTESINSIAVKQLEKALEAAKLNENASKNKINPSLNLVAQYSANSIARTEGQTTEDLQNYDHPTTSIGLELTVPFSFSSEKSEYLKAYANKLQLEAQLSSAKDGLASIKLNSCRALDLQIDNISRLSQIVISLKKREGLEYKDFKTGRTTSFNYIQAGVDAISAEINYIQAQTNVRLLSWQIISESKSLSPRIEEYAKSMQKVIQ